MRTIQIREVPEGTYRTLRGRAAAEGLSLTAYLRRQLDDLANRPTMTEWLAAVHSEIDESVETGEVSDIIRARRDGDDA
jgi:plasmid stability protein